MNVEEILGEDTYTVIFRLMQFCDYIINKDLNDEDEDVHFLVDVADLFNHHKVSFNETLWGSPLYDNVYGICMACDMLGAFFEYTKS